MNENKLFNFIIITVCIIVGCVAITGIYKMLSEPTEKVTIDTSKTDSMQVFYSKQLDSIKVENQLLQVKIEAKTETIRTLKGLVKENNHYFESITDSALFEELKKIRSSGIK